MKHNRVAEVLAKAQRDKTRVYITYGCDGSPASRAFMDLLRKWEKFGTDKQKEMASYYLNLPDQIIDFTE